MSAIRKVAFTTVSSGLSEKKEKSCKSALRFEVNLAEPTKEECTEISYEDFLCNNLKKKGGHENGINGSANGLDPYASDDENQLEHLAKKFESKYGAPVKKKSKRKDDFVDKGAGYDESDSFIDNSEAYDEYVPPNVTTALGGFYINCGELEFKAVEFSESESSSEESSAGASGSESSSGESDSNSEEETTEVEKTAAEKPRKRLKALSTDGSESSRGPTPTTEAPPVVTVPVEKPKPKPQPVDNKPKKPAEEPPKLNGTTETKVPKPPKPVSLVEKPKPPPDNESNPLQGQPPQLVKKPGSSLDSIFDTIESVVKAGSSQPEKSQPPKPSEVKPQPTSKPSESKPQSASRPVASKPSDTQRPKSLKVSEGPGTPKDSGPPAISRGLPLSSANTPVTKEGKLSASTPTSRPEMSESSLKEDVLVSDESDSEEETSSSSSESEIEGDASDTEEAAATKESDGRAVNVKLPESLPFELVSVINALKEKADDATGVKSKFFTNEVNSLLFRIELFSKQLKCGVRQDMYDYLTSFLPCKKLTLLKRARTSLADHLASRKNSFLSKLKDVVNKLLPDFLDVYEADISTEEDRIEVFRRFLKAQEEVRGLLSKIIFLKCHHFSIIRSRKDSPKEAMLIFFDGEVCAAFPDGFVSAEILYREMEASHSNLTSDKKLSTKERKIENLRLLSLLIKPTKPPKTVSPIPKSPTKKSYATYPPKPAPPAPRPPEPTRESKLTPNWDIAKEIEMKILAEAEYRRESPDAQRVTDRRTDERSETVKRPRTDSPESGRNHSEPKRKNLGVSNENRPKPKVPSPKTENPDRPGQNFRPPNHSPDNPRTAPHPKVRNLSPANCSKLPSDSLQPGQETYRASVVSVENMSELARRPSPKSKSPKPKVPKTVKEKPKPPEAKSEEAKPEPPKTLSKPAFEQNMDSAKAVESLFAIMSPGYESHELENSPETDIPQEELVKCELVAQKTVRDETRFETITPPEKEEPETDKSDAQPDLSWVIAEMSQISQITGDTTKPDQKEEDQNMHDSFGKMFELAENAIKDTRGQKPTRPQSGSNGNFSAHFEQFINSRSPPVEVEESPIFASKKHKALKAQSASTKPLASLNQSQQQFMEFLGQHGQDFGACSLSPASEVVKRSSAQKQLSRTNDIPSYSASQYFSKQKEAELSNYYPSVDYSQRQRRELDWGDEEARKQDAERMLYNQRKEAATSRASVTAHGSSPQVTSRSQPQTQMYEHESLQTPLNFSRSTSIPSMMPSYSSVQGYQTARGYAGMDERTLQAYSQLNNTHSVEALTSQMIYQQQQRTGHYPPDQQRSSQSGSGNYTHSSQR